MAKARALALISVGAVLGGTLVFALPFARYSYARVGTNDLQRVDRWTGRVDWAGGSGWWNEEERFAPIEKEVKRFGSRVGQIAEDAKAGRLRSVQIEGRKLTVYPLEGEPFEAYAANVDDPRLRDLVTLLRKRGVAVGGA